MVAQAPFRDVGAQLWRHHVEREAACKRRSVSGKVRALVQRQTEKEMGRREVRREERRARARLRRELKDVSSHGLAKGAFYFDCAVSWLLSMGRKLGDGRGSWSLGQVYILNWFLQTLAPTFWHPAVWRNHHADLRKRYGWEEHRPICLANTFRQAGKTVATDAALAAVGLFAEYAENIGFFAQGIRVSEESLKECLR